jgi:hypothetical protein
MPLNQSELRLDENYFQRVLSAAFTIQENNAQRNPEQCTQDSTVKVSESRCIAEEPTNDWLTLQPIDLTGSLEAYAATLANSESESQPIVEAAILKNFAITESNLIIDPAELSPGPDSLRLDKAFNLLDCDEAEDGGDAGELLEFVPESEVEATVKRALLMTRADGATLAFRRSGNLVCRTAVGYSASEIEAVLNTRAVLTGASRGSTHLFSNTKANSQMDVDACQKLGVRDVIAVPIVHHDHWLALIAVFSRQPYAFGTRDLESVHGLVQEFGDRLFFAEILRMHTLTKFKLKDLLASNPPSAEK